MEEHFNGLLCGLFKNFSGYRYFTHGDSVIEWIAVASVPYVAMFVLRLCARGLTCFVESLRAIFAKKAPINKRDPFLAYRHFDSKTSRVSTFKRADMIFLLLVVLWRTLLVTLDCGNICSSTRFYHHCDRAYPADRGMASLLFCMSMFLMQWIFKPVFLIPVRDQSLLVGPFRSSELLILNMRNDIEVVRDQFKLFFMFKLTDYTALTHVIVWLPILSYVPSDSTPSAEDRYLEVIVKCFGIACALLMQHRQFFNIDSKSFDIELELQEKREEEIQKISDGVRELAAKAGVQDPQAARAQVHDP